VDKTTHERLIPCEKHAAILGREAARLIQRREHINELRVMLAAIAAGRLGSCSHDGCIVGDDSDE